MPELTQRLRNRVRERRIEKGLNVAELAALAAVNRFLVGNIDRDEGHAPSGTVQLKLAEALGTTVQDLFWSEPAEPEQAEALVS